MVERKRIITDLEKYMLMPDNDNIDRQIINKCIEIVRGVNDDGKEESEQIENIACIRAIDECIKITEETVWKDADMLVGFFEDYKRFIQNEE